MAGSQKGALGSLLEHVLDDPLGLRRTDHIRQWLEALKANFPLWTWQAEAYVRLHTRAKSAAVGFLPPGETLPSAYPAQALVDSILGDDGVHNEFRQVLTPLQSAVSLRRTILTADQPAPNALVSPLDWNPQRRYEQTLFWFDPQDAALRALGHDPTEPLSIFDTIGRMLVEYVESLISAPNSKTRNDRRKGLDSLRFHIAAELGVEQAGKPGGQPKGPRQDILRALVAEGRTLFELLWKVFPLTLSSPTRKALTAQGVRGQEIWAAQLALPVLSRCELQALRAEAQAAAQAKRGSGPRPTPLRFTVWVVAWRLGLYADSVARKALHSAAPKYFLDRMKVLSGGLKNPIGQFCKARARERR